MRNKMKSAFGGKKILSLLAQAMTAITLLLLVPPISTTAIFNGGDGMDIAQRLEVCKLATCTENDWYNYSGDLASGSQTLTMKPGETFKLRIKSWAPTNEVLSPGFILFSPTAGEYLDVVSGSTDLNADGDAISYTAPTSGTLTIPSLPAGGNQNTAQSAILTGMQIKSNVPDQTLVQMYLGLQLLTRGQSSVAYAQFQYESEIRILVTNPSTSPTVRTLPQTGASTPNK